MREARTHRPSLRTRLVGVLIGATALIWGAALAFIYFDTRDEVGEMLDAHLAQSAAMLLARGERELGEIDTEHAPQLHRYARKVVFQVWEHGTALGLHSANAPQTRLSAHSDGFSEAQLDGKRWRVFSAWSAERRYLVQVAERYSARNEISEAVVENLIWPMLTALPVLALIIWIAVSRGLHPIRAVGMAVQRRDPARLDPVDASNSPAEIAPLVDSLNRLFERVTAMVDKERRFTSDAAHELRTPLAALRAQAQVARSSSDDQARDRALEQLIRGCDRASHLVEQLLTLARVDPGEVLRQSKPCDLRTIAADTIALIAPMAIDKGVDIELFHEGTTTIDGDAGLLGTLVRNLVDNAVRYSPAGTGVRVDASSTGGCVEFRVSDQGPGIPGSERERVWERFYRIAGSADTGSGLGLSIVRRIADLHGAQIELGDAPAGHGLLVTVRFPAARTAQR